MYRSRFSIFATIASAAIVFASAAVTATVRLCTSAVEWLRQTSLSVLANFSPVVVDRPRVALVVAKSYVARAVKRQAPRIESTWRMCPST